MKFVPKPLVETADASRGHQTWKARLKGIASAVIILGACYLFLGWTGLVLASFIPDKWEKEIFAYVPMDIGGTQSDSDEKSHAQEILNTLLRTEGLRDLNYNLVVLDESGPNAFAFPGGTIGVTSGLLNKLETDEGLAFVLAHEIGHHQHRHILKGMGRRLVLGTALSLLFDGDIINAVSAATEVGESRHSRKHESEADLFALALTAKNYGPSTNLLEFLELVESENDESVFQAFLGTHPLSKQRLHGLRKELQKIDSHSTPVYEPPDTGQIDSMPD